MRIILLVVLVLLSATGAHAAVSRSITYYLDGARVDEEIVATRGYAEIVLPAATVPDSLRIRPVGNGSILRVEIQAVRTSPKHEKEFQALVERKRRLEDRLRALDAREKIFMAAAKSQSSKAPRKTKTNPEPMENIRKGTEFAVAQLEEVYRARRATEDGIKSVETRLSLLKKEADIGRRIARVWVVGKGRIAASYLLTGSAWTPAYDFRLDGNGTVDVTMRATFPRPEKGTSVAVTAAPLTADGSQTSPVSVAAPFAEVVHLRCPVEHESGGRLLSDPVAFSMTNCSTAPLPPGEATVFRLGEYVGKGVFAGLQPGSTGGIAVGTGTIAPQAR